MAIEVIMAITEVIAAIEATTKLLDVPRCKALPPGLGTNMNRSSQDYPVVSGSTPARRLTIHRSSLEWTLPCHGGDHEFESRMGRLGVRCF